MAILSRTVARSGIEITGPSLKLGPVLLAAGAIIVVIAVLQVMQTSRATTASFKIEQFQRQRLELETSVSQLEVQIAGLSSLARIQQEAKRLGLGPPASREVVEVSVPGPSGDSAQIPARLLQTGSTHTTAAAEQKSSWWENLLKHVPFR